MPPFQGRAGSAGGQTASCLCAHWRAGTAVSTPGCWGALGLANPGCAFWNFLGFCFPIFRVHVWLSHTMRG